MQNIQDIQEPYLRNLGKVISSDAHKNYDLESIMKTENLIANLDKQKFNYDNVMSAYSQLRHKRATPTTKANTTNTKSFHLVEKRAVPNLYFTSPLISSHWFSDSEETPDFGFIGTPTKNSIKELQH